MEIPKKLQDEIWDYCRLNEIPNINEFINKMVGNGFNVEKFGNSPFNIEPEVVEKEVEVIKEVIVEKRVEVPVEVIKEVPVEVIKEVIKEVEKVVEKEVYKTDDEAVNVLQKELDETNRVLKDTISDYDEERKSCGLIVKEHLSEIENLEGVVVSLQQTHDEMCGEIDSKVDVKYKTDWEKEVIEHNKTKEEVVKLKKHLSEKSKGGKGDFYGEGGNKKSGWWK